MATYRNVNTGQVVSYPAPHPRLEALARNWHRTDPGADVAPSAPEPPRPARNATKVEWRAYAVARGADPEVIEPLTRDQLRAEYGG